MSLLNDIAERVANDGLTFSQLDAIRRKEAERQQQEKDKVEALALLAKGKQYLARQEAEQAKSEVVAQSPQPVVNECDSWLAELNNDIFKQEDSYE